MWRPPEEEHEVGHLLFELRRNALRYEKLRGRPLGVTSKIGELVAAQTLDLHLAPVDCDHDVVDANGARICVRSRLIDDLEETGPLCVNGLKFDADWDDVMLVLLDRRYDPVAIYRARRADLVSTEQKRQRSRKTRPAFSLNTFRSRSTQVWPK